MIYLASPYSDDALRVEQKRYEQTLKAVHYLSHSLGRFIYSPVVHFHPGAIAFKEPTTASFWERINLEAIRACKEVWVLQLAGYDKSEGVTQEIKRAKSLPRPIKQVRIEDKSYIIEQHVPWV